MKTTNFYTAFCYDNFLWKGFGVTAFVKPKNLFYLLKHLQGVIQADIAERVYKHFTKGIPSNRKIAEMRQEFTTYHYQPELNSWEQETAPLASQKITVTV